MKADQRKQLEQNELASTLARWWKGEGAKKVSPTTWAVIGLVVLVILLIIAWRFYADSAFKTRAGHWRELQSAVDDSQLEQIIQGNRGTAIARVAKAQLARGWLSEGLSQLGSEVRRDAAIERIEKARQAYAELLTEATDDPALQREALMALAKCEESLVGVPKAENSQEERGSLDRALEYYEQLADKHKDSVRGKAASERAEAIKKDKAAIIAFYRDVQSTLTGKKSTPLGPPPELPKINNPPLFPPTPALPKYEPPKIETPKIEGPPAPKEEPKKSEATKGEPKKIEAPKGDLPSPKPKDDAKKGDAASLEAPARSEAGGSKAPVPDKSAKTDPK